jgi:hypothetical protein
MMRSIARTSLACLAVIGCVRERDRLDVPRVTLELTTPTVAAGDTVRGRAWAVDGTGIIFFQVTVETDDSVAFERRNRISADSVMIEFALPVSSRALVDERVIVTALTRDDQDFEIVVEDTVYIRASALRQ